MNELHVHPIGDLVEHELTDECPCGPQQQPVPRDDGSTGWLVLHNSLDGREAHESGTPRCAHCLDDGHVCEDHPEFPWEGLHGNVEGHAAHGGIGMPCPACCLPVPQDETHLAAEAFTPGWVFGPGRERQ